MFVLTRVQQSIHWYFIKASAKQTSVCIPLQMKFHSVCLSDCLSVCPQLFSKQLVALLRFMRLPAKLKTHVLSSTPSQLLAGLLWTGWIVWLPYWDVHIIRNLCLGKNCTNEICWTKSFFCKTWSDVVNSSLTTYETRWSVRVPYWGVHISGLYNSRNDAVWLFRKSSTNCRIVMKLNEVLDYHIAVCILSGIYVYSKFAVIFCFCFVKK